MKSFKKLALIKVFLLLIFSSGVLAQYSITAMPSSQTVLEDQMFSVEYTISSSVGVPSLIEGMNVEILFDTSQFSFNSFTPLDSVPDWSSSCFLLFDSIMTGVQIGVSCEWTTAFNPGTTTKIVLGFIANNVGLTSQAAFNFNSSVFDVANFPTVVAAGMNEVLVNPAIPEDFSFNVTGQSGQSFQHQGQVSDGASLPFSFELHHEGVGFGSTEQFDVIVDPAFTFTTAPVGNSSQSSQWLCNPFTGGYTCFNGSSSDVGEVTTFTGSYSAIGGFSSLVPSSINSVFNVDGGLLFDGTSGNNTLLYQYQAPAILPPDFKVSVTPGSDLAFNFGDTNAQQITYKVKNIGADVTASLTDSVIFDINYTNDFSVLITGTTPTGWTCVPNINVINCVFDNGVFTAGMQSDFVFDVAPALITTPVAFYSAAITGSAFNIFEDNGTLSDNTAQKNIDIAAFPNITIVEGTTSDLVAIEGETGPVVALSYQLAVTAADIPTGSVFHVFYDQSLFTYNPTLPTNIPPSHGWSCTPSTGFLDCSITSPIVAGTSIGEFTLAFDLNGATATTYTFGAQIFPNHSNTTNDMLDLSVVVSAPLPNITLLEGTSSDSTASEGQTPPVVLSYQLAVVDAAIPVGNVFNVTYNDSIFTYNPTLSVFPAGNGWSCSDGGIGEIVCAITSPIADGAVIGEMNLAFDLSTGMTVGSYSFDSGITASHSNIAVDDTLSLSVAVSAPIQLNVDFTLFNTIDLNKTEAVNGEQIIYKVLLKNDGGTGGTKALDDALNVHLIVTLPAKFDPVTLGDISRVGNFGSGEFTSCTITSTAPQVIDCLAPTMVVSPVETEGIHIFTTVNGTVGDVVTSNNISVTADNFASLSPIPAATFTIVAPPSMLSFTPTSSDTNVIIGGQGANYTFTLSNTAPSSAFAAGGLTVDFQVLTGFTLGSITATGWTCTNTVCTNDVAFNVSDNVDFVGTVNVDESNLVTGLSSGVVTVQALDVNNLVLANLTGVDLTPSWQANYEIVAGTAPNPIIEGDTNLVPIIFNTNILHGSANGASFSVPHNSSFTFDSSTILNTGDGWTCADISNVLTCSTSTILPDGNANTFTLNFNASSVPATVNPYQFVATFDDTLNGNNDPVTPSTATVGLQVNIAAIPEIAMSLTKDVQPAGGGTSLAGGNITREVPFEYNLTVSNDGAVDIAAGTIEIVDDMPLGVVLTSLITSADWMCTVVETTVFQVTCNNVNPVVVGGSLNLTIPVIGDVNAPSTPVTNIASVALIDNLTYTETITTDNNSSVDITIDAPAGAPSLTFTKLVIDPSLDMKAMTQIVVGTDFSYELRITNNSTDTTVFNDLVVVDVLQTGFYDYVGHNVVPSSGVSTSNANCNFNITNSEFSCDFTGASLSPGKSINVTIDVTATNPVSDLPNVASISSVLMPSIVDKDSNVVLVDIIDIGLPTTSLSINKSASQAGQVVTSVTKGAVFQYDILVNNTGAFPTDVVTVIDTMPDELTNITLTGASISQGWSCSNNLLVYTCTIASIPSGDSGLPTERLLSFNVKDVSVQATVELINAASASSTNATTVNATHVLGLTSVAIDFVVTPTAVIEGSQFPLTITLTNTGSEPLQSAVITNILPVGFSYVLGSGVAKAVDANNCTVNASNSLEISCPVGTDIPVNGSDSLTLQVQVGPTVTQGAYNNSITVTGSNFGQPSVNHIFNVGAAQGGLADLQVTKTVSATNVITGNDFIWLIDIKNNGPDDAISVLMTDVLTTGTTFVSATADQNGTCSFSNFIVSCTTSSLANQEIMHVEITVMADLVVDAVDSYVLENLASVSSDVEDVDLLNNKNSATIVVDPIPPLNADLQITKTASVAQIITGNEFTWLIDVKNNGPDIANNVVITDTLATGLTYVSATADQNGGCTFVNDTVSCQTNSLADQGVMQVVITVKADLAAGVIDDITIENTASTSSDSVDTDSTNDTSTASILVKPVPPLNADLQITKTASVAQIITGNEFTWLIDVKNNGPDIANNVVITDTLATGLTYVNATADQNGGCTFVNNTVSCQTNSLANQGVMQVVITVKADLAAGVTGDITIENTASTSSDSVDTDSTNDTSTASILVKPVPPLNADLQITKTASVAQIITGNEFTWLIDVKNNGPDVANNVVITDTLATGLTYVSASADQGGTCTFANDTVNCQTSSLADQGVMQVVITVKADLPAGVTGDITIENTASTSSDSVDTDSTNDTSTASILVKPVPPIVADLQITKTASVAQIITGNEFTWLIDVKNNGPDVANNVVITDTLATGLTYVNATADQNGSCTFVNDTVSCQTNSLADQGVMQVVITVKADLAAGVIDDITIENTASTSSDSQDQNIANNMATASIVVNPVPPLKADLKITKSASVSEIVTGNNFTWLIEVTNDGPDAATNVVMNDVLTTGFSYQGAIADQNGTCTFTNNTVSCQTSTLAKDAVMKVEITGVAELSNGTLNNDASVVSDTDDTNTSNNDATASILVKEPPPENADLALSIQSVNGIDQGDSTQFEIKVNNFGPGFAIKPEIAINVDGILDTVTVNASTNALWNCNVSEFTVSCLYKEEQMPNGHISSVFIDVNTTRVVIEAQDVIIEAQISSETQDDDLVNNKALGSSVVDGTPTEGEIETVLTDAIDGPITPVVARAIEHISSFCEIQFYTALEGLCADIFNLGVEGEGDTLRELLNEIAPTEVIGQSSSVAEIAAAQFRNVGARLSELRGGGGSGFSSAGLRATFGNGGIPLDMLSYLNQSAQETDGITQNTSTDFISPWGFFVNGNISMGKRDATDRELQFDFDTFGLTAGFDYRISSKKVIGVALGYANFNSNIENDSAKLNSTGLTLTGYGSFYINDNFYVDTRISVGRPTFDQSREIDFTIGSTQIQRTAKGETSASQYSVAMSAGYIINKNSWNITPNASFQYIKTSIDGFTETGAGDFNFIYSDQELESLVWSAGIRLSKAISLKKGVITPQFDFDYNYESKNDTNNIRARFIRAPSGEVFIIETDTPDRTYGSAGLGFVYISSNGKQAYINYRTVLGLEGFSKGTINLGARFEF